MKDSDIIVQATIGNKGAYRELLRKYANLTLAVAFARSGNSETARLAAADTFVEASKELANLPETALIPPWIASITRAAVQQRMSGTRRVSFTPEAARGKILKVLEEAERPDSLSPEQKNSLVFVAFNSLSDEQREVLSLLHIYSNTYSEIASAMAAEADETDDRIAKAREQMASVLDPLFARGL